MQLPDFLSQDKYGFVHLTGHRVGLNHVVDAYKKAGTVLGVCQQYPTLSREDIAKVVEFYRQNQREIDDLLDSQRAELDRDVSGGQSHPSREELRRRRSAQELAEKA